MWDRLFSPSRLKIGSFPAFCQQWLVDPYPLGVVYWKTLNLYRELQYVRNVKVTQYFMAIVSIVNGWNFISKFMVWLENDVLTFSETLAGISTLTQWKPCYMLSLCFNIEL